MKDNVKRRRGQAIGQEKIAAKGLLFKMYTVLSNSTDMGLCKLQEIVKDREAWRAAVHEVTELDTTE